MNKKVQLFFQQNQRVYLYLNEKNHSLTWAFFLTTIFFSPYLFTSNPHFNFFGDVAILYFPQFVEGYHMAKSGALVGIDFLTSNGSTAYFLRPNIPVYYPPYQLTYALFHFDSIEGLARAFVIIAYAHSTLAAYFCMRIGRKYLQMDYATSILFSVLYFGAIAYYAFTAPPFFYVAALFPFLLYFALQSTEKNTWWQMLLCSFSYVMVFLSGYPPLAVNAVLIVLLITVGYLWQNKNSETRSFGRLLISCFAPPVLAGVVVVSFYMAMVLYHKQVTGVADGVWHSAHQFSFESRDIFALLSRAFPASNPGTGTPFVQLGLVPALLLVLAFSQRKKLAIAPLDAKIIALSILIFSFYLLLAFGQATGLPDLVYFTMPVIGKMHFYGRYLLIASFFFYLAVAISFKYLVQIRAELPIGRWLVGITVLMALVQGYTHFRLGQPETFLRPQLLVIELLMLGLVLISLSTKQSYYAFVGVIGVTFLIHAANFNSYINSFNQVAVGPYKNEVAFFPERRELLLSYFKKNSNKILNKYADITLGIEKPNGVMLNSPWLLRDKLKISNYMGYEPHLAVDRDYMAKFPFPYYGKINIPWLLRTGADFIIYNEASWAIHSAELEQWVDKSIPELDLWYGYKVAKLKNVSGLVDDISARTTWDFDNGIVRVSNTTGTALVTNFETDFVSSVRFNVKTSSPVTVRYALFPNKMMELRINGNRTDVILKNDLLEFTLPPGEYFFEYKYKNTLHLVFIFVYLLYIAFLISIVGWRAWLGLRSFRNKISESNKGLEE
jgi:hypothetical protein